MTDPLPSNVCGMQLPAKRQRQLRSPKPLVIAAHGSRCGPISRQSYPMAKAPKNLVAYVRQRLLDPREIPVGLSDVFATDEQKSRQWAAYSASIDLEDLLLDTVVESIWSYLGPACERLSYD